MNTTEYYKQCVKEVKNLKGVLTHGKLTEGTLNLLNGELKTQSVNYKPFISGLSEIIDINDELKIKIELVCSEIMPVVDGVFGCNSKVQEIKILRHLKNDDVNTQQGAFIWHSDRHVPELINVMLYLNDVTEIEHGPFQYIESNGEAYYNSIVKNMTHKEATSYGDVKSLLGEAGSFYVFDNNFIHRASVPTKKDREAIILQVRPTKQKQVNYIDMSYIGQGYPSKISNWSQYE